MTIFRGGSDPTAISGEVGTTAQDLLDLILTVDGAGSTLDADTVDGNEANIFAFRANNLSDLDSASTAFGNIKQAATETATGVVEKATTTESQNGTDADKFPDVVGVKAHLDNRLAQNSGTIPEVDRINTFVTDQIIGASGSGTRADIYLEGDDADTDGSIQAILWAQPYALTQSETRLGGIVFSLDGSTAGDRGGKIDFRVKGDAAGTLTTAGEIDNTGGLVWGSPTGGSGGAGVINAEGVQVEGTDLPRTDTSNTFTALQTISLGAGISNGLKIQSDSGSGHDFRLVSKSDTQLNITDETDGVELFAFERGATDTVTFFGSAGGILVGAPTGGSQGGGTLNAQAVYDDGSLLTDYVMDAEIDGQIDTAAYDDSVPNRRKDGEVVEVRSHRPARDFSNNGMDELDPANYSVKWRQTRKLPAHARLEQRARAEGRNKLALGEINQALLETCEVQAVHIERLRTRLEDLETRLSALENA